MADHESELEGLLHIGFTRSEATTYLILLQDHPATAYEISKRGGLTKSGVYAAIETLVRKGAVQPVSEHPVKYGPVELEQFFSKVAARMATQCSQLATSLARRERKKTKEYVWTLTGDADIDGKVIDMINAATTQVWLKGSSVVLSRYLEPLRAACERGVHILTILFGDESSASRFALGPGAKLYLHEGSGDVLALGNEQFAIATDYTETLIAKFGATAEAAHTRSEGLVFNTETMIRHEVYLAEIMTAFGPAIEERFGKGLASLRELYLSPDLARAFKKHRAARAASTS
jgi:HTH-type transcriptional regulator, sugar sensing transcriptional regulator